MEFPIIKMSVKEVAPLSGTCTETNTLLPEWFNIFNQPQPDSTA